MKLTEEEFIRLFPSHHLAAELKANQNPKLKLSKQSKKRQRGNKGSISYLEETLFLQLRAESLIDGLKREHRFHPTRRWRMDFAWPKQMLAVEVEGGVWGYGRHNRPRGFIKDTEKYNQAALKGWTVLRFTGSAIRSGQALKKIKKALAKQKA